MYYAIGSNWSERKKNGSFDYSNLNIEDTFIDWFPISNEEDDIEITTNI